MVSTRSAAIRFCSVRRLIPNIPAASLRLPGIRAKADTERRERKVLQPDQTLACVNGGSLQNIAKFPHITGPIVLTKKIQRFGIDPCDAGAISLVQTLQHDIGDGRDIFLMFTQRRNYDLEDTQPIVKFFAQVCSEILT